MYRLYLFFIISISISQNNFNEKGEKNGYWVGYHENGSIKYEGQFINNKEQGLFRYYDYNGNVVIELNYIDFGITSEAILYYVNGVIKSKGYYMNKQKHSLWMYYNRYGKKNSEENYVNGVLNGKCIYFYENNIIAERYNYLEGMRQGEAEVFYPSGYLNMKCNYYNNQLHGVVEFYYDKTMQLESKGKYVMGLKDSIWVFYDNLGDTLEVIDYQKHLMQE